MLDRLKNDPRIKSHVSTFYNLNIAEKAITDAMKKNKLLIENWIRSGIKKNLIIHHVVSYKVGFLMKPISFEIIESNKFTVVLKPIKYDGKPYFILTSFVGI
ncbi:hypothetical protein KUK_1477 [Taylorella equigenitalis 14/56]|uniref:Bacterial CdiA-CT RNAse A domain-containing protein n=1 Tax=Taylorella equigenitalis 14/56 TaxID=1091497 RepID=I7JL29_9BURK|nr:hypothetical protein KUK_1477 [Taylorella equigenitalis 14/56]